MTGSVCGVCRKPDAPDVRLLVRDDYGTIRGSYALPLSPEDDDRVCGVLDSIVDGYRVQECRDCRREAAKEQADELEWLQAQAREAGEDFTADEEPCEAWDG